MRDLTSGKWLDIKTEAEFKQLLAYGRLDRMWFHARVQKGDWQGPGKYKLFQYTQRCPRNCCDDNVNELLTEKEVIELVKMQVDDLVVDLYGYSAIVFYASEKEIEAIDELCDEKELNREQILRQALRLYQAAEKGVIQIISSNFGGCGGED
jgi:hypothetical protein